MPHTRLKPQLKRELALRQQAERSLRESEVRYRKFFSNAPTGNFVALPDGRLLACNPAFVRMFGFDSTDRALERGFEALFPDTAAYQAFLKGLRLRQRLEDHELILRRAPGEDVIALATVVGRFDDTGNLVRLHGYLQDITLRKRAEAERRRLARRLAEVQEAERTRLSRELHDQMGQEIAALHLRLKSMLDDPAVSERMRQGLFGLAGLTDLLARRVHQIGWELRPSVLDDLGLDNALKRYAADWTEQNGVLVDYQSSGLVGGQKTDPILEITLYRIAQEALHNVAKHARARHVSVLFQRRRGEVLLTVEDNGQGFEVETVMKTLPEQGRLGLLGMRERASLVGGVLTVESTPGQGTAVFVRVPLANRSQP